MPDGGSVTERMGIDSYGNTTFTGDVMPAAENLYNIGSAALRWEDLYADDGFLRNAYIDTYIYHNGDTDTYLQFQTDRQTHVAGGIEFIDFAETTQNYITIGGSSDIDTRMQGGSGYIFIQGSNGYIGINDASPSYPFEVAGNTYIGGDLTVSGGDVGIGTTPSLSGVKLHTYNNSTDAYNIFESSANKWVFGEAGGKAQVAGLYGVHTGIAVDTAGSVGIGITSPSKKLDVNGAIRTRNSFNISDGTTQIGGLFPYKVITGAGSDNSTALFAETGLDLHFMTNGSVSTKAIIKTDGNVGIGTSAPGGALHVYNGGSERFLIDGDVKIGGSTDLYITGASRRIVFSSGNGTIRNSTANDLLFQTNGANTRMAIKSNGPVGVGTDSPDALLDVYSTSIYGSAVSFNIPVSDPNTADTDYAFASNYSQTRHHFRGSHEILLGRFTLRDGSRYLDIKTNINSNSYMFGARAIGYLYNRAIIDSQCGGYAYTSNSVLNKYAYTSASTGNTIDSYRASGGELCFRIDSGGNGYTEGILYIYFYGHGNSNGVQVANYIQNDSSTNYYA